jgi:hypothetical protein
VSSSLVPASSSGRGARAAIALLGAALLASCSGCSGRRARAPREVTAPAPPAAPAPPPAPAPPAAPAPLPAPPLAPASTATATLAPPTTTVGALGSAKTPRLPKAAKRRAALGVNLHRLRDYTGDWPFVDAFKNSRFWLSGSAQSFMDQRAIAVNDDGWPRRLEPGQVARALMFWADGSSHPSGAYTVLYEGRGTVTYANAERRGGGPGRDVIWVPKPTGGFALELRETDPADPIRNVRVLMPGGACAEDEQRACSSDAQCGDAGRCVPFESSYRERPFHPDFLRQLAPFSVLRFMEWSRINEPPEVRSWAERGRVEHATWTARGVPYEVMIALGRRVEADVWLNLPSAADDDFVDRFGALLATALGPDQRVYVELSNEVWNDMFPHKKVFEAMGADLPGPPFQQRIQAYARRSRQVFERLARHVPPGPSGERRLVRVLGAQSSNAFVAKSALVFEDTYKHVDALAIGPYFGGYLGTERARAQVRGATLDQAFQELEARGLEGVVAEIRAHREVANRAGIELVAYEGGQHLVGVGAVMDDKDVTARFLAVNRDPRIGKLYTRYLDTWRAEGGGLMVLFALTYAPTKFGAWGLLESTGQTRAQAPKYDAALRWIEQAAAR